jgi:hypothetical protein
MEVTLDNHQTAMSKNKGAVLAITLTGVVVFFAALIWLSPPTRVSANTGDIASAEAKYPNIVNSRLDTCTLCHTASIPSLNSYGAAYLAAGRNPAALTAIENLDSDGDGWTNIQEIMALTFPGNAADHPSTPTNTATSTATTPPNPTATRTSGPTSTRPAPTMTGTPGPTTTAKPTKTIAPDKTPKPTKTINPDKTPKPTKTIRPDKTPKATRTAKPTKTPKPKCHIKEDRHYKVKKGWDHSGQWGSQDQHKKIKVVCKPKDD